MGIVGKWDIMRSPTRLALLLVAFAIGCGDDAVAPGTQDLAQPVFAAFHENGEGVFVSSGDYNLNCLNETVREAGTEIAYRYHLTVTPSGHTIFVEPFIPGTGTGTLLGLSSGTIWTLDRVVSPYVERVTAGTSVHFTANIWWVSETGPTLNIHSLFHISTNANGQITAAKVDLGDCRLH